MSLNELLNSMLNGAMRGVRKDSVKGGKWTISKDRKIVVCVNEETGKKELWFKSGPILKTKLENGKYVVTEEE